MKQGQFELFINMAKSLSEDEYYVGYRYGLRRHYHGKKFGNDDIIEKIKNEGGLISEGINDGLNGRKCQISNEI